MFSIATQKLASKYDTEEDSMDRKMQRHMTRGYEQEKGRLAAKGKAEGKSTGKWVGGLGGGAAGAYLGAHAGGTPMLVGGALGALAGWHGGKAIGGSVGRSSGIQEAKDREHLAKKLRAMAPEQRREHINKMIGSMREKERLELDRDRNQMMQEDQWERRSDRNYSYAKKAAFGAAPVHGEIKAIGGVKKVYDKAKGWIDHAPSGGGLVDKMKSGLGSLFKSAPEAPTKVIVNKVFNRKQPA